MSSQEQANLQDIFALFDLTSCLKQTSHILQFLWQDLTSSFDIVGPYITSENQMTSKFFMACVLETVKLFQVRVRIIINLLLFLLHRFMALKGSILHQHQT